MSARITALAAFAMAFGVYLLTLCPSVYVEGSGELIGSVYGLGTPHPTGYPLFCLSGRLIAAILPFDPPAYEVNLASALFAAAACGALAHLLQQRGVGAWVALASALVMAFSHTFWSQAVIAEVYGQALLLVVVVMAQALRTVERRERRELLLLAWLMGLGLTAHLMQMLVWPGVAVLLLWRWPGLLRRPLLLGQGILAGLGGYSLVAYLPLRNGRGEAFHWDPLGDPASLWHHLSGGQYSSSFFSLPLEGMLLNAQRWAEQVAGEFHPLLLPLLAWGIYAAWRRDRPLLLLAGGAIVCNLVAALNYHRDPNGLPVFFLLSLLGLAVLLGLGFGDLARRVGRWCRPAVLVPVCALVVAAVLGTQYAEADHSRNWVADRYARDILDDVPEGAVLIAEGDDAAFALDYLLRVEGVRPDLEFYTRVGRGSDLLAWREHDLPAREQSALRLRREAELARQGRALFYLVPRQSPLEEWVFVPEGLVYRLRPEAERSAHPSPDIEMGNALAADFYRDAWVRKIQANYWFMAGEQRQWAGDVSGAIAAYEQAAALAYDSRSTRFNVALKLYRNSQLRLAEIHARAAIAIDPWKADPYKLLAHILGKQNRLEEARQLLKKAGELRRAP